MVAVDDLAGRRGPPRQGRDSHDKRQGQEGDIHKQAVACGNKRPLGVLTPEDLFKPLAGDLDLKLESLSGMLGGALTLSTTLLDCIGLSVSIRRSLPLLLAVVTQLDIQSAGNRSISDLVCDPVQVWPEAASYGDAEFFRIGQMDALRVCVQFFGHQKQRVYLSSCVVLRVQSLARVLFKGSTPV
jgi:hypothetical protein